MKKLIIVASTLSVMLVGFCVVNGQVAKSKSNIPNEKLEQLYSTTLSISWTTDEREASNYEHCNSCNIGVYLPHGDNKTRTCTHCGAEK